MTSDTEATKEAYRGPIAGVLASQSFWEKVLILVLSGLIVPLVIYFANMQFESRRKIADEQKVRTEALLASQEKLLNDATEVIFTYETLALDVSWFKS